MANAKMSLSCVCPRQAWFVVPLLIILATYQSGVGCFSLHFFRLSLPCLYGDTFQILPRRLPICEPTRSLLPHLLFIYFFGKVLTYNFLIIRSCFISPSLKAIYTIGKLQVCKYFFLVFNLAYCVLNFYFIKFTNRFPFTSGFGGIVRKFFPVGEKNPLLFSS